MKKTLELFAKGFESSSEKTPEFNAFARTFKKEFTEELKSIGAQKIEFHVGHFEVSGFYTIGTQVYYFKVNDVRFSNSPSMYYRTAKNYKDYCGGCNQNIEIFTGMGKAMNNEISAW